VKLESREDGQVSAKVKSLRLASGFGDTTNVNQARHRTHSRIGSDGAAQRTERLQR